MQGAAFISYFSVYINRKKHGGSRIRIRIVCRFRIRIQSHKNMRIHADLNPDPDPHHWSHGSCKFCSFPEPWVGFSKSLCGIFQNPRRTQPWVGFSKSLGVIFHNPGWSFPASPLSSLILYIFPLHQIPNPLFFLFFTNNENHNFLKKFKQAFLNELL